MFANKTPAAKCDCNVIHEETVRRVLEMMPKDENLIDLADFFKVFSDFTRIKIISALLSAEMCVCDIAALLGMTKSSISHQLRVLKNTRLVKYRREGKKVFYSLDDIHIKNIFEQGLTHIAEV